MADAGERFRRSGSILADWAQMWEVLTARFEQARLLGRAPTLLYIGPHYTVHELERGGAFDFGRLEPWAPRMAFVDANPRVLPLLRDKLRQLGVLPNASDVIHAAVCAEDGMQNFFMASEAFFKDRNLGEEARKELEFGMSMIRGYTRGAGVPEEYIVEVPVRCLSPASLLKEVGMEASVDLLLIDAEGYDLGIMERLLKVDGFAPAVAAFEWSGVFKMILHQNGTGPESSAEFNRSHVGPLLSRLAGRGYDVYQHEGDLWALARP